MAAKCRPLPQVSDMKKEAPKAMQWFINQSIDFYMGPYSTDLTGITAAYLQQGNRTRLMFANAGSTYWLYQCVQNPLPADCKKYGDRRNPGLYGTMTASNEQWWAVIDHAVGLAGAKSIAVITQKDLKFTAACQVSPPSKSYFFVP